VLFRIRKHSSDAWVLKQELTFWVIKHILDKNYSERDSNMAKKNFHIKGRIIERKSGQGVKALRVEAWDKDLLIDDLLGTTKTDTDGAFEFKFDASYFRELFLDRSPDLFFKVFHQGKLIRNTEDSVLWNTKSGQTQIEIMVDLSSEEKTFIVHGRVLQADGTPVAGITVKAVDKDVREESLLGETTTEANGRYSITYYTGQLSRPDKTAADLIVRAYDNAGNEVAVSTLILSAAIEETVALILGNEPYQGPAEYTRLSKRLAALLDNTEAADLTAADVTYLASKTGLNPIHIAYFVKSAKLARKTAIDAEFFYGWFRQQLPTSLNALVAQDPAVQKHALETAVHNHIISKQRQAEIDAALQQLQAQIIEHVFEPSDIPDRHSLSELLDIGDLSTKLQRSFMERYVVHQGSIETFWQGLREDDAFGASRVASIQLTLQLGALTLNHVPLVKFLQQKYQAGEFATLRDCARFTQQDWMAFIQQPVNDKPVGYPPTIPGETAQEKISNYALTMTRIMEDAFATTMIAYRIHGDDFQHAQPVADFLQVNTDFDFRAMRISQYLAENKDALAEVEDKEAVITRLKAMQRLFNIAPRYNKYKTLQPLLADSLDSAYAICRIGKSAFKRRYSNSISDAELDSVYANAASNAAMAQSLYTQHVADLEIPTNVTPPRPEFVSGLPEWRTLFGSLTLCRCEHCRSVYSPAAYLVDCLHFLSQRNTNGRSALQILFERRSDIGNIELNCKNTNTVLPYIDLVNEVLENAVAPSGESYQTLGRTEALRVEAEHVNPAAYAKLTAVPYPWSLPFDLFAQEARIYLQHLGVPRHELLALLHKDNTTVTAIDIAAEQLGLTPTQRDIITANTAIPLRELLGMDQAEWYAWLADPKVLTLLNQAKLDYDTLLALLAVAYINPNGQIQVAFPSAGCHLEEATLVNLSEAALNRMQRFVRLQMKLGWEIYELDAALRALADQKLSELFLLNLANVLRLRERFNIDLIPLLSWWSDISTVNYNDEPSLYESLFLNKAVTNPVNEAFQLTEMATNPVAIDDHIATILAGLEITDEELVLLRAHLLSDEVLSLANLSRLYAAVSLARALRFSIQDLLTLLDLSGVDPFVNTTATLELVELTAQLAASDFTIAELNYLLRHQDLAKVSIAPSEQQIGQLLLELRNELQKLALENRVVSDPNSEQTAQALASLLTEPELSKALAIIDGSSTETDAVQQKFIEQHFAGFLDIAVAKEQLVGANRIPTEQQERRFNSVLQPLLTYLAQRNLVKQKLAAAHELGMASGDQLLTQLLPSNVDPRQNAMADFLSASFINSEADPLTQADFPTQFRQFSLLGKIAILIRRFSIPAEELAWMFADGSNLGWLDFKALPVEERAVAEDLFAAWLRMAQLIALERKLSAGEHSIYQLFHALQAGTIDRSGFITEFSIRTGCAESDMDSLVSVAGFNFSIPTDFQDENAVARLATLVRAIDVLKRIGVSAEQLWQWNTVMVTSEQALAIKRAIKAKYEETHWLHIAKPLRDVLREQQRSALVDYLVHARRDQGVDDANDLFGHFLLDVEMSACMLSSRIKQAISSVQLFVQRCLMNLEPEVQLQPSDVEEWAWMKNYRVWEANRKIFLYPENWIEPELRDDKSPFFQDLENELLQNDVTSDTVESVYLRYLEKLDEVARLEISGMYEDEDSGILHVFGRTRNTPHIYYYRRWVDQAYWTPWERVDVDIRGDHLIPVVYNRRLHIFWPIFLEKAEDTIPAGSGDKKPKKYYEIQLAWSEYKNGKWQATRISTVASRTPATNNPPSKDLFRFWASINQNQELIIFPEVSKRYKYSALTRNALASFKFHSYDGSLELSYNHFKLLNGVPGTKRRFMHFVEKTGTHFLELAVSGDRKFIFGAPPDDSSSVISFEYLENMNFNKVLEQTPSTFVINLPHQFRPFTSQAAFFYEDNRRTFLVLPKKIPVSYYPGESGLYVTDNFKPEFIDFIENRYLPTDWASIAKTVSYRTNVGKANYLSGQNTTQNLATAPGIIGILADAEKHYTLPKHVLGKYFHFANFYHPYVPTLIKLLNRYGIKGFLNPAADSETPELHRQMIHNEFFKADYLPTNSVTIPYPLDEIDFDYASAYSLYNWELFFHAPFLIANRLSNNQCFAEAQQWYHYIFDPTDVSPGESVPARFWKIKPFYEATNGSHIQVLLRLLDIASSDPLIQDLQQKLREQINIWRQDPFKPHAIARLRNSAYQKAVVMKYLDNLIAWGDSLFRRDTIESINEATQLYVLAAQILGKRPVDVATDPDTVPIIKGQEIKSYNDLAAHLDAFSNALIELETALPGTTTHGENVNDTATSLFIGPALFFCIPRNDKLLKYWDTAADRLFKIRHCMNIEGIVRQLPLFEPPIPPGLLVKAAAAGVDISSALNDLYAPAPHYRYQIMLQKAVEFCAEVKSMGASLLAALEKRDAEAMALLRSGHEILLLDNIRQIKEKQIKDAEETLAGLQKSRHVIEIRKNFYISRESFRKNAAEMTHLTLLGSAGTMRGMAQLLMLGASSVENLPDVSIGVAGTMGSPLNIALSFGGTKAANSMGKWSTGLTGVATIFEIAGQLSSLIGSYQRREEEWKFQADLAGAELEQIDKQIAAAEIRLAIAEQDLKNHQRQIENTKEIDSFMRDKFTNQQLYSWMVSQISTIYFQSYQMAYELAKRAERAFRRDIGDDQAMFIEFGYWDSLKKGLLAGERLHYDLRRMEVAYFEQNQREFELTKHISLAQLDPLALIALRQTGSCTVSLPEVLFDLDLPGHYQRRIKSIGVSIPCVTGPYTGVHCTLSLLRSSVRHSDTLINQAYARQPQEDPRFTDGVGAIQSVVTSGTQNDSGLFEINLRDERYLPFEGAGVISEWRIELPENFRQFDYNTISDLILHMRYTARGSSGLLKEQAVQELDSAINTFIRTEGEGRAQIFSLRHQFPNQWHEFLNPVDPKPGDNTVTLALTQERFPFLFQSRSITVEQVDVLLKTNSKFIPENATFRLTLAVGDTAPSPDDQPPVEDTKLNDWHGLWHRFDIFNAPPGNWTINAWLDDAGTPAPLTADAIEELFLVCHYSVT
jgi:hypothetical protein